MRRIIFTTVLVLATSLCFCWGQDNKSKKSTKYHRSSLHMILVETHNSSEKQDSEERNQIVLNAYENMPFPDKYDEIKINATTINPDAIEITEADLEGPEKQSALKGFFKKQLKGLKEQATEIVPDLDGDGAADLKIKIEKYFKENKVANQLVARWFDRQENGTFDMSMIQKRGIYDAQALDVKLSEGLMRGNAVLKDAGKELIGNTFVVVTRMKYVRNEVIADAIKIAATRLPAVAQLAAHAAADAFLKEGYSVWTKAFLYQLDWNDSIESVFYKDYWMDKSNINPAKKKAFDETDLFKLKYVGKENALTMVTATLGEALGTVKKEEARNYEDLIRVAAVRTIEKVYVKLQKHNEVFMPKVPIYTTNPVTAKIGKKEGLKGGEKFEVLEQQLDPKTGKIEYIKRGVVKVPKKDDSKIWDNRFSLDKVDEKVDPKTQVTIFEGSSDKYYPGMLLKQIK